MAQKLRELMAQLFEMREDEIMDSLTMKDIDAWDSLKHMELVVSIEQTFGIELTFDEIVVMQTFKEIRRILAEKLEC